MAIAQPDASPLPNDTSFPISLSVFYSFHERSSVAQFQRQRNQERPACPFD